MRFIWWNGNWTTGHTIVVVLSDTGGAGEGREDGNKLNEDGGNEFKVDTGAAEKAEEW